MKSRKHDMPTRLLIADDDPRQSCLLECALEEQGYDIAGVVGGTIAAVEVARYLRPALVLADVKMPTLDGITIAKVLSRERIAPVLLLTDGLTTSEVRRAAEAGIYSFVARPIQPEALTAAIEIALGQWETIQRLEEQVNWLRGQEQTREVVDRAKRLLMRAGGLSEAKAYRLLQTRSMNTRRSMRAVAQAVLTAQETRLLEETAFQPTREYQEAL